jgi:hypothetical protein
MKPFPVRFLGVGEVEEGKAPTAVPTEDKVEASVREWAGATIPQSRTLNKLEKSAKSHEDFARNASMLDFVSSNEALLAAVNDPSNYQGS